MCVGSVPLQAQESSQEGWGGRLGFNVGFNYSFLGQPADQPGDVTVLAGSAFSGVGFAASATYEVVGLGVPWLGLESGLAYASSSATGFEIQGDRQREILIEATSIRLPLYAKGRWSPTQTLGLSFGLGPEVAFGLSSASTVRERNIPQEEAQALRTTSVTALLLTAMVGAELDAGPVSFPLRVHASFNPFVGDTTADRSAGVEGGQVLDYRMEFNFEMLFTIGVAYSL